MNLKGKYTLNTPNKNGHIYTKACVMQAVQSKFGDDTIPVYLQNSCGRANNEIVGYAHIDFEFNDSIVPYEIELLDNPAAEVVKDLLHQETSLFMVPNGLGRINDKGEIVEYSLISMDICTSSAFEP